MLPNFTYPISSLRGASAQAVSSADRPLCALVSAFAAMLDKQALGGAARMLTEWEVGEAILGQLYQNGIPSARAHGWAAALNHTEPPKPTPRCIIDGVALDPYQLETVDQTPLYGGVLSLGVGLGKTLTAVALAARFANRVPYSGRTRCWIVCPLNAMPTWERMRSYLQTGFKSVQIISMDSLHKFADAVQPIGGVIIFDEVHMLGEQKARRTKAAHKVRLAFDAGFCLTGTLLHGGIEKALSIQDLAIPGLARFASRWKAGEYFKCLVRTKIGGRTVTELKRPVGLAKEAFKEYLSWGCVSMTKESAIVRKTVDIPEQEITTVEIGDCTRSIDEIAANWALEKFAETGELPHAQAVAHGLCSEGLSAKIDWLMNEMDDPTQQVVIFCMYTASLDAVEYALVTQNISFVRVDGTVTGIERAMYENKFQSGAVRVFLGQQAAASVSMNLQNACISVTIDHDWKAANYDQSLGRTCRRGQTQRCYHFDLVANKLQQRVVQRLRDAADFDASVSEYQDLKRAVLTAKTHVGPP